MGRQFMTGNAGATAIEYALIAMLVAVSGITAFALLGGNVSTTMDNANAEMSTGIPATRNAPPIGQ